MKLSLAVALAGCVYRPGSYDLAFSNHFPGTRLVVNCLDLAVARRVDADGGAPVVEYSFGNRCTHRVDVDLTTVRVVARDAAGAEVALAPYDPRRELEPKPLDALTVGSEQIEYPTQVAVASLCVDVGGLDAGGPRHERWVCIASAPEVVR